MGLPLITNHVATYISQSKVNLKFRSNTRFLGGANWGTLRIPREDWGHQPSL